MPLDSGWPASRFVALLDPGAKQNQDQFDADLQGYLSEDHLANGQHGNIHAQSITVGPTDASNPATPTGKLVLVDSDGNTTELYRSRTLHTVIDLLRQGVEVLIRQEDTAHVLRAMVRLGNIPIGPGGGNGIALCAPDQTHPTLFHDWAITSGGSAVAPGARLMIGDITNGLVPISLRYRQTSATYELMKTTDADGPTTQPVTLGSGFDSALRGYFDGAYLRSIEMESSPGNHETLGLAKAIPYNAGNFFGSGGLTWTVPPASVAGFAYTLFGRTMKLDFWLDSTTVSGTPDSFLIMRLPAPYTVRSDFNGMTPINAYDNGTVVPAFALAYAGNGAIYLNRPAATWSISAANTFVRGFAMFPIQY